MIKIENVVMPSPEQWKAIVMGARNPLNSWARSDSSFGEDGANYELGENDFELLNRLANAGTTHAKYRRMITVYVDITAPLYWWKEFDQSKVGTVTNSCSTMHKIHSKEFTMDDFSHEHLYDFMPNEPEYDSEGVLKITVNWLNHMREKYLKTKDKNDWWQMIQLLPSSYNQKRTVMLNYEVLAAIYPVRKDHKLDEWHKFCDWIKGLPCSELITGEVDKIESNA